MPATPRKKRVAVFIDGSNLYFKIKTLVPQKMDLINYRYRDLFTGLLGPNETITYIGYYIGVVKVGKKQKVNEKAQQLRKSQQQLFASLQRQRIEVVKGFLMERDGRFTEKGVDVRLALDIASMAYEKKYDVAFVISSDTDLVPAIQKAYSKGSDVVYIGFEHQPSLALIRYASRSILLSAKTVTQYEPKPLKVRRFDDVTATEPVAVLSPAGRDRSLKPKSVMPPKPERSQRPSEGNQSKNQQAHKSQKRKLL